MATTPPLARRIHTPPGPLHGPKHDSYEPYSPRRSRRISAQSSSHILVHTTSPTSKKPSILRETTPQPGRRATLARTISQTFSPPSSPTNSPQRASPRFARRLNGVAHSELPRDGKTVSFGTANSDSEAFGSTPASRKRSRMESLGMLPTPSKTPRKSPMQTSAAIASTARVLFPSRSTAVDDVMPTPRKARIARSNHAFKTLDGNGTGRSSKIEIFQDSRDRVPDVDGADENPFVAKTSSRQKSKSTGDFIKRGKAAHQQGKKSEVEDAIEKDEGMVYVFRGKKVFRRFEDVHAQTSGGEESDPLEDNDSILRRAGAAVRHPTRPFTRSCIKPRILFPSKDQVEQQQTGTDDVGEEDLTDIDETRLSPSSKHLDEDHHASDSATIELEEETELITPVKAQKFRPATPPPTARKTRASAKSGTPGADSSPSAPPEPREYVSMPKTRGKRFSPFDAWQRTKPGVRNVAKGTKREGDVLERESGEGKVVGKRTRSGSHAGDV